MLAENTIKDLQRDLQSAKRDSDIWKKRYKELQEQTKKFMTAQQREPELTEKMLNKLLNHTSPVYPKEQKSHYRQTEI